MVPRKNVYFIANFSFQMSDEVSIRLINSYKNIRNWNTPLGRETGRKRGLALIEMIHAADEQKAIDHLHHVECMAHQIRANKVETRKASSGPTLFGYKNHRNP